MKNNIAAYLKHQNMTQKQLAELIGVTESAMSHYVDGSRTPKITTALKIANALDCNTEDLYKYQNNTKHLANFLNEKKTECLHRAEHCDEQIAMFERSYKNNESAHAPIAGYPTAIIPDEHGREQYISARVKREGFLAQIELIEQIQELYKTNMEMN